MPPTRPHDRHRSWSASRPRPATTHGSVLDHARAKLARKGCDLLVVNDVGRWQRSSGPRTTRPSSSAPTGRDSPCPRGSKAALGPRDLGPGRWPLARARAHLQTAACVRLASRPYAGPAHRAVQRHSCRRQSDRTSVHLRVRHRGPPGQDRRPDQRRHPRRHARAGPAQPGRRRDDGDHRPGARRRRGHHRRPTSTSPSMVRETDPRHRLRLLAPRASTASPAASRSRSASSRADIAQGVDHGLRGPHRRLRRRARQAGRRRPGPDVRLRLRRHPRADAAADHAGAPARRAADRGPQGRRRCPTCAPTARPRSPSSTTDDRPVRVDTVVLSTQHAADIDLDDCSAPTSASTSSTRCSPSFDIDLARTTGCWSTRPAAS